MPTYMGSRSLRRDGDVFVTKDGVPLSPKPSQKVWNHSPDGFNWGYGGSGPAKLALAILLDVTGGAEYSVGLHQDFKWDIVAGWGDDTWDISTEQVWKWIKEKHGRVNKEAKKHE